MKKRLIKVLKFTLILLMLAGYVFDNIKSKSVYYATNMPHGEGKEPALVMLIDNLYWVYTPDIEGLKYDIDGTSAIIDVNSDRKHFGNIYDEETEYVYNTGNMSYWFNRRFELIHVIQDLEMKDVNTVDESKVISEIKEFVAPVIDEQTKPLINLQWLFNMLYQDEFK